MIAPNIQDESGTIVFDWSGGMRVEAKPARSGKYEIRVLDSAEAKEGQPVVIGLATISPGSVRERKELLSSLAQRDGNVPDWDARLLLVADHLGTQAAAADPGVLASEVQPEEVSWVWPRHIPAARITGVAGDPDVGKSMLMCDLTTRISVGGPWPDGAGNAERGRVLIMTTEDGVEDTIVPRLERHGADLTRIRIIGPQAFGGYVLPDGIVPLEVRIRELGEDGAPVTVIMDPIEVFLAEGTNTHRSMEIRQALAPLEGLADRTGAAIIAILHLNKKSTETTALYRLMASIGFVAACRSVLVAVYDPEDATEDLNDRRRVFGALKGNLTRKAWPLTYRIVDPGVIQWEGPTKRRLAELMLAPGRSGEDAPQLNEASAFLLELLAEGPQPAKEVRAEAKLAGIADRTLDRAKEQLGVTANRMGVSGQRGGGTWYWALPEAEHRCEHRPEGQAEELWEGWRDKRGVAECGCCGGPVATPPEDWDGLCSTCQGETGQERQGGLIDGQG